MIFLVLDFSFFGVFNHLEIVCGALVLTGVLTLKNKGFLSSDKEFYHLLWSGLLLFIALAYTYIFIPHLTASGLLFNQYSSQTTMPSAMIIWHGIYWLLEITKLLLAGTLLRWHYRSSCTLSVN